MQVTTSYCSKNSPSSILHPRFLCLPLLCLIFFLSCDDVTALVNGLSQNSSRPRRSGHRKSTPENDNVRAAYSSPHSESGNKNSKNNNVPNPREIAILSKALRMIYSDGGTLGVLNQSQGMEEYDGATLFEAAIEASQGDKGMASGIVNALLGSCCGTKSSKAGQQAQMAVDIMKAYDDNGDKLKPDLVSLALAYVAMSSNSQQSSQLKDHANQFLFRAEQMYSTSKNPSSLPLSATPTDWYILKKRHNIKLLQESKDFIVVSKPSGMVCYHPTTKNNKKKRRKNQINRETKDLSLEECLLQNFVELSTLNKEGRGMVHRIDRGTSGCIVLAKTNAMHAKLISHFFLRNVNKSYQALIWSGGTNHKLPQKGTIDMDIDGRPALSNYEIEKTFGTSQQIARICVITKQGRRHQVRIHCSRGLRSPILLDPLYGGLGPQIMSSDNLLLNQSKVWEQQVRQCSNKRFCLHANFLEIPEEGIEVQASLPDWWQQLEQELESF